jgi:RimJ/RimL family protein N-acetyltransferase
MKTRRLELIPARIELCEAEARGRAALEAAVWARVPPSWPPPVFEPDDVARIRRQLEEDPAVGAWTLHYVVAHPMNPDDERHLVGVAGFVGPPTTEGRVEIGYAVAAEYQRRGYASEAVEALVSAAFRDPRISMVTATTYPTLGASIRVLTKTGFVPEGSLQSDGTITFVRRRDLHEGPPDGNLDAAGPTP